ncbi:MAG TPA: octanoyltransferase, partial [Casimicrobiaceae bacterium]|nr:octanoyltransferase [Casimicrobiaceae bacterium]
MIVRHLGTRDYEATWRAMQAFTNARSGETPDE